MDSKICVSFDLSHSAMHETKSMSRCLCTFIFSPMLLLQRFLALLRLSAVKRPVKSGNKSVIQ